MKRSTLMVRGLVVAAALSMVALLGACSSPDEDSSSSSTAYTPVTIDHEFGSTTIDAQPQRVVTLLTDWSDTLAALDIPITAQFVEQGHETFPWTPEHKTELVAVNDISQVGVAEIAKFDPDVILAGYLGDEERYKKLSEIAPTVPVITKGSMVDSWELVTTTAGKIFGKQEQAQQLIDETNGEISAFKSKYPSAVGKTFTFAQVGPTGQVGVVNSTEDASAGLLAQLGFTLDPQIAALHNGSATRALISPERINLLNSDLLVVYLPGGDQNVLEQVPGWSDLKAVRNGTVIYITNDNHAAFSVPSAPSVSYVIQTVSPAAAKL
ncbi:ABC transporter substrate-binding protein [Gordonia sp. NPDC003376]